MSPTAVSFAATVSSSRTSSLPICGMISRKPKTTETTMKHAFSELFEKSAGAALLSREFRLAVVSRYFHIFSVLALLGGIAAAIFSEDANAAGFFHLQIALYFVA